MPFNKFLAKRVREGLRDLDNWIFWKKPIMRKGVVNEESWKTEDRQDIGFPEH
jgi:hypothetical protein